LESVQNTADNVKSQLTKYGSQIQEYLKSINANVENYKFSVEKGDNGALSIDLEFRATISG
jgi:hypothetical protein